MSLGLISWSPGTTLDQLEREAIFKAWQHFRHNKTATAQALGISIRTLDNKFERYQKEDKAANLANENRAQENAEFLKRCRGQVTSIVQPIPNTPIGRTDVIQKKIAVNNEADK